MKTNIHSRLQSARKLFAGAKMERVPGLGAAFTIVEVLIALTILSVIIVAIYTSWYSILKGSKVALDAAAATQRARISMRTLQDALLSTCNFAANQNYYSFLADSDGDFASLSLVARLPKSFPRSGRFGDLQLRRVSFTVEPGPENKRALMLRQSPIFMDPDKDEMDHPLVLARDVNNFILEFLDPRTGEWISEWTSTNQLPKMVRITLGLGHLDKFSSHPQEVKVTTVALPAQLVQVGWQMPGGPGGGPPGGAQPLPGGQVPGQVPGGQPPQIGNPQPGNQFGNPQFGNQQPGKNPFNTGKGFR